MLQTNEVRVAVTGQVLRGKPGTIITPPTGTTGPLPADMIDLGFIDEKGVTEDPNKSTKVIKSWQKGTAVRTVVSDGTLTYKFRMIQTNADTTGVYFGTTVEQGQDDGSFVTNPTNTGGRFPWIFEVLDGTNHRRIWVPQGEVTDTSAITYVGSDETGYEITVSAYYDNTLGGNAKTWDTALKLTA